ncbi:P-loop containing nucleoside triphosphate hydrolase protein [Gonapodya prolifera JEL478]|uniref:p-loop containing nucleoside triphosphate hydrolase protein n=1 Tax=Gonapodya prolifera (strain JEL478) TaxID=1344416 RepID=A0A139ARR2_GONPJ|nr:P-loop containing nucleoside triphosphate hydrolase protein [Gonapodya prolifera JEL478]|eukprot:KXS19422.1 P-loop containing nucleoside triphosphate hydrolase protein [Gonapodya prolifera JEL478]
MPSPRNPTQTTLSFPKSTSLTQTSSSSGANSIAGRSKQSVGKLARAKRKVRTIIDSDEEESEEGASVWDVDAGAELKLRAGKANGARVKKTATKKLKVTKAPPAVPAPRPPTPPAEPIDSSSDFEDAFVNIRPTFPPNLSSAPPPLPYQGQFDASRTGSNGAISSNNTAALSVSQSLAPGDASFAIPKDDIPSGDNYVKEFDDDYDFDEMDIAEIDALSAAVASAELLSQSSQSQKPAGLSQSQGLRQRPLGEWLHTYSGSVSPSTLPAGKSGSAALDDNSMMQDPSALWYDKHEPCSEADLATAKKKVAEVKEWLQKAVRSRGKPRVLFLYGAAGTGKTTTIRVLAHEMDLELVEWVNPVDDASFDSRLFSDEGSWHSDWGSIDDSNRSAMGKFVEFLRQVDKYPSLAFTTVDDELGPTGTPALTPSRPRSRLILIEDLPNLSSSVVRSAFHSAISSYLSCPRSRNPLVLIMSNPGGDLHEERGRRAGRAGPGGAITAQDVVPPDVRGGKFGPDSFTEVEFKPVAPTFVVKALERISRSENLSVDGGLLEVIADGCGGDVRSAVGAMQFFGLGRARGKVGAASKRRRKGTMKDRVKVARSEMPEGVGLGRESTLLVFHALGKILHNKREHPNPTVQTPSSLSSSLIQQTTPIPLPPHMSHLDRPVPLKYNPEAVVESAHVDPRHMVSCLHQNYVPFFTDVEPLADAAATLADADVLMRAWNTEDIMGPYATLTASRGVLFSYPVDGDRAGGMRQIYMPEAYKVVREARENDSLAAAVMAECTGRWIAQRVTASFDRGHFRLEILPTLGKLMAGPTWSRQRRDIPGIVESSIPKPLWPTLRRLTTFSNHMRRLDTITEADGGDGAEGADMDMPDEGASQQTRLAGPVAPVVEELTYLPEDDIED